MPYPRFLFLDTISCALWVLILSGAGYFFSGAVTNIIGDFKQIGIALFFIVMVGIVGFYLVERYWLSEKVEEVKPETIHRIEEKIHNIEVVVDRLQVTADMKFRLSQSVQKSLQMGKDLMFVASSTKTSEADKIN